MRFPGGCYIEGAYADGATNRFEWKKSVGPIEERPGHLNRNWGYKVTDGLGYHECLQLAEDLGAHALFVVNMGLGHDWKVDENNIDPFIQEALDAIEYANGSATDTFYGRMRA
jgi:alpha-L-arabinofuranosidase